MGISEMYKYLLARQYHRNSIRMDIYFIYLFIFVSFFKPKWNDRMLLFFIFCVLLNANITSSCLLRFHGIFGIAWFIRDIIISKRQANWTTFAIFWINNLQQFRFRGRKDAASDIDGVCKIVLTISWWAVGAEVCKSTPKYLLTTKFRADFCIADMTQFYFIRQIWELCRINDHIVWIKRQSVGLIAARVDSAESLFCSQ